MVRRDVVAARVTRAAAWLDDAGRRFSLPVDEFARDVPGRDLALFYLFLAIQECIDLAAHWVADAGWMAPDDAGSTFDVLADHAAVDRETADRLRAATELRNRFAHGYALLDYPRVHGESRRGIPALREFLDKAALAAGL